MENLCRHDKEQIDAMFFDFEQKHFDPSESSYPYNTALVFAFADYVDNMSNKDLAERFVESDIQKIRKAINNGINKWLRT